MTVNVISDDLGTIVWPSYDYSISASHVRRVANV